MRVRALSVIILAAGAALLLPTGIPAPPAAAASTAPATLYVADLYGCSDSGPGTSTQPFCTISAAAAVVQPGQTVMVFPSTYHENVTISRSGTATAPIRFVAAGGGTVSGAAGQPTITVVNAAHVELQGLIVAHGPSDVAIEVDNSSQITIDRGVVNPAVATSASVPGIQITGASSAVTVSRETVEASYAAAVQIGPGVSGTVLTDDTVLPSDTGYPGVVATDAPDTTITGNTVVTGCGHAIELDGNSGGSVENNILETANGLQRTACTAPGADGTGLTVSAGSASQTTADYNLLDPASGGPLYSWAGTDYSAPAQFTAATGQGAHDSAANPQLAAAPYPSAYFTPQAGSPAIDSANAAAPGETATDFLGHPREDDPSAPNTGTAPGYFDRGAVEVTDGLEPTASINLRADPSAGPLAVAATLTVSPAPNSWPENVPPRVDVLYYFGVDGLNARLTALSSGAVIRETLPRAGEYAMHYYMSPDDFRGGSLIVGTPRVVVGADYTPVAPLRLLDTRNAIGVTTTTPVPAGGQVVLPITGTGSVAAGDLTAVVANVTVTQPTAAGYITVYPDSQTRPTASNLNFRAGQTVANLVTVPVVDGKVVLYNGSHGTAHLILDLQGYYSGTGQGYKPLAPLRVLDTRDGTGTTGAGAVAPHTSLLLSLGASLPAGASAAVLNLTATQPTAPGYLTAYPAGAAPPTASNLNFTPGQTIANLVIVPVVNGQADIYNGSNGTVQIIADLEGFYGTTASGANLTFVPYGPVRVLDTRTGTSGPLGPHKTLTVFSSFWNCGVGCPAATASVLNVTAVDPQDSGYLTVYPYGQPRPLASNLNFTRGSIVPNLAIVASAHGAAIYNGSSGSVQIVVDEAGYFITPPT